MMSISEHYDAYFERNKVREASRFLWPITDNVNQAFKREIHAHGADQHVLELGCGDDQLAKYASDWASSVTAVDISKHVVQQNRARHQHTNNLTYLLDDCEDLQFDDDRFQLVFGKGILPCVDLEATCTEIQRVLTPDGSLVLMEPLGSNPAIEIYRSLTVHKRADRLHYLRPPGLHRIKQYFPGSSIRFFNLFTLLSAPLGRTPYFENTFDTLHSLDRWCFRNFPFTRSLAWWVIISWTRSD